ncbi:conserved Plasmodium protein, unknown function [Plasmodium reichenowi]|uniref:Uncharacterized protein n=1 Tax=Plasmodium reichenowi TaxID=5854 RepID=A0A2P9DP74_PLARE|nr:conserved Plasmodium protein, unknown function [Plasmodium reichenowi]
MKDIKELLKKLHINKEKEFEKDVRLLFDMKKYIECLTKKSNNNNNNNDKTNCCIINNNSSRLNSEDICKHSIKIKQDNLLKTKHSYNNPIEYVERLYKELKGRTPFEYGYYKNILNNYNKYDYYNYIMKNNYNLLQDNISNGLYRNNNNNNNNNNNSCDKIYLNNIKEKCENLMIFFHMYLIRKYCEKNYYECLHNKFIRSITYNYLDKEIFYNYVNSDLYFLLYSYIQTFAYILLKNENQNIYLMKLCSDIISRTHEELSTLRKEGTYKMNTYLYDKKNFSPYNNSLIKYVHFIVEYLSKNKNYNYMNILYGIYSCVYVFSNVFYSCSLSYNSKKVEQYMLTENIGRKDTTIQCDHVSSSHQKEHYTHGMTTQAGDNISDHKFVDLLPDNNNNNHHHDDDDDEKEKKYMFRLYYKYIKKYGNTEFMKLNEFLLYYISKENIRALLRDNINYNDMIKDLNIVRYTTYLEKYIFKEISTNNMNKEQYSDILFRDIKMDIFKSICNISEKSPLYIELNDEDKKECYEIIRTKCLNENNMKCTYENGFNKNVETQDHMNKSQKKGIVCPFLHGMNNEKKENTNDNKETNMICNNYQNYHNYNYEHIYNSYNIICTRKNKNSFIDPQYEHFFFEKTKYNLDDAFFKQSLKNTNTLEGNVKKNTSSHNYKTKFSVCPAHFYNINYNLCDEEKEKKKKFLNFLNNNDNIINDHINNLKCIDEFFHISIDFDKTIIKKDSYSFFYKLLCKHYNIKKPKDIELTQEETDFFENMNIENIHKENKKNYTYEERINYIYKISKWYIIKENKLLKELQEKQDISNVYSDSYYYYLKKFDQINITHSALISYYDILKDVDINAINSLIYDYYDRFQLNDYFLDVFLRFIQYKQQNNDDFFFDIITLNFKKQIVLYTLQNNIMKLENEHPFNVNTRKASDNNDNNNNDNNNDNHIDDDDNNNNDNHSDDDNNNNNNYYDYCKDNHRDSHNDKVKHKYYQTFKKYFNVYYSKMYSYDKEKNVYTGGFEYNKLKIKHKNYNYSSNKVDYVTILSLFDKTVVRKKVCTIIKNTNHKLSCFIGDSIIDLDAMLSTDIPILLGCNQLVLTFCKKHNIVIKPLIFAAAKIELLKMKKNKTENKSNTKDERTRDINNNEQHESNSIIDQREKELSEIYDENKKVIYATESWLEIGTFFFGKM